MKNDRNNEENREPQHLSDKAEVDKRKKLLKDSLTPSYSVKEKYSEIKGIQGRKPLNKWVKVVVVVLVLFTIIFTLSTSFSDKARSKLEDTRVTSLDLYESTKFAVFSDVRDYLTIQTKEDYQTVKSKVNLIDWYKDSIFGTSYDTSKFYGAEKVTAVDLQYALEDNKGVTKYLLMLNVTKGDITKQIDMVVFTHKGVIFDILVV